MRALLVYNPHSGRHRSADRVGVAVDRLRAEGWQIDVHRTTERGDGARAAAAAALEGRCQCVIAAGGDGTVHEVVNGILSSRTPAAAGRATLGVLPLGTGCDFARNLGIGLTTDDAVERLVHGTDRPTDILHVTRSAAGGPSVLAVNSASLGLGGRVVARANGAPTLKRVLGPKVFLWAAAVEVARGGSHRVRMQLDDRPAVEADVATIAVLNGAYFGGAMHIAPDASLTDGWLDVVTVRAGSRHVLLRALGSVYSGNHRTHPLVWMDRARRLTITPLDVQDMRLEVDGELAGRAPVTFEVLPGAIAVRS